jgi:two-component system sensor histidine kinase YesM
MVKEKEAELLALQSQINPHFLYNTLDSIFWMAERAKCKNISKMVLNLSKLFKLSLNNGDKFTTIKREFEHIYTYLEIQNIRYRGKFKTLINIDPDLLDKKIMRLIIQPIVENSIYHGIEPMSGDGLIEINGVQENNTISIVVRDNGIGFNTDEIETRGYALKNINKRIKLNYGNEYGLLIKSRKNEGTTVTIRIPATN